MQQMTFNKAVELVETMIASQQTRDWQLQKDELAKFFLKAIEEDKLTDTQASLEPDTAEFFLSTLLVSGAAKKPGRVGAVKVAEPKIFNSPEALRLHQISQKLIDDVNAYIEAHDHFEEITSQEVEVTVNKKDGTTDTKTVKMEPSIFIKNRPKVVQGMPVTTKVDADGNEIGA